MTAAAPGAPLDLLVVGAGPAGIAAAIVASRAGQSVLVVDAAAFPRDKTCGDGLTTGALRLLDDLGFSTDGLAAAAPVDDIVLVAPSGREIAVPLPRGSGRFAAVVPRVALDDALVAHARSLGVDVRDGVGLSGLRFDGDVAVATLSDGTEVRAAWVVAADGHYSTVRRLLAPEAPVDLGSWHAARQYFTGVNDPRLWVLFERDLLPGYAWVFPLPGGRANVGFGVLRDGSRKGKQLKALWPGLLARPSLRRVLGPNAVPEDRVRAWPIPAMFNVDDLAAARVLFVGDAANVVDPMTGEGIAQALETGTLAAEAIAHGGSAEHVRAHYTEDVARRLGRDLHFAWRLQRLLRTPRVADAALRLVDTNDWTRRNFARWMFEDYPRAQLFTPDRWRRGALSRPGV